MASTERDARSTFSPRSRVLLLVSILFTLLLCRTKAGHHHGSGSGMEKLLAAGLIAKALSKGGDGGGGGGGGEGRHQYMPIPIPLHGGGGGGGGGHHHHVHHKYVPIPVKHHTNFIIAHHRIPVPVHVPVPVVKTKLVHVPMERTKIVPIIVHKGQNAQGSYPYSPSTIRLKKARHHSPSASSSSGLSAALSSSSSDTRQLRITSLGTVRKLKDRSRNGTATSIQYKKPSSRSPDKWIVVVKNKKRPSTIRRLEVDAAASDTKVIPRAAVTSSSTTTTAVNTTATAGPR